MTYNVPAAGPTVAPVPLVDTHGKIRFVIVQNTSGVTIWISDNQSTLGQSAGTTGSTPQTGFVLAPNSAPVTYQNFTGKLYALAQAPGGQVECADYPIC